MSIRPLLLALLLATGPAVAQTPPTADAVAKPVALTADGIPPIPATLARDVRRYLEGRSADAVDWNPVDRSLLISTRFANVAQLHSVAKPGAARRQITFETDRISGAHYSKSGDTLVVGKDVGGGEFFQLYTLKDGQLGLVTDGKSRNAFGAFSRDGRLVGYSSTRRTGTDTDLYVVDPRDPKTDRMVAQVKGGGWSIADSPPTAAPRW